MYKQGRRGSGCSTNVELTIGGDAGKIPQEAETVFPSFVLVSINLGFKISLHHYMMNTSHRTMRSARYQLVEIQSKYGSFTSATSALRTVVRTFVFQT